jgi:phytoene synthase
MGLSEADLAAPQHRPAVGQLAARLVAMARPYRRSARIGAARLPYRSRLTVLAADGIYGTIGEKVAALGKQAWDQRVRVGSAGKLGQLVLAALRSLGTAEIVTRTGLWTRPRQS